MKRINLLVFFLIFSISCGNGNGSLRSESMNEKPEDEANTSAEEQFFNHLKGVYRGIYKNTVFEVWIEELEQVENNINPLSILVFEYNKSSEVQQLLTKYKDIQAYSDDVCEYLRQNPEESPNPELAGINGVWDNIAGLGYVSIPINDLETISSFDIATEFYINLPNNDEHGLKTLHIDSKGQVIKIQLFETGYFKKPWNYFFSGPSIEILKIPSSTTGLLDRYYRNINELKQSFLKMREENRSYCDEVGSFE